MADPEDPDEILDEQEGPVNRGLRIVGESGFGLLVALTGGVVVAWGVLVAEDSIVAGGFLGFVGVVVVLRGAWIVRG